MYPAVSQLNKSALSVTYDITDYIHEGDNEIMLWIGQGWGRVYGTPAVVQAEVLCWITNDLVDVIEETCSTRSSVCRR